MRLERTSRRRPKEIIRSAAADGNGVTGNFCDGHSGDRQLHSLLVLGANLGITDVRTGDRGFRAVLEAAPAAGQRLQHRVPGRHFPLWLSLRSGRFFRCSRGGGSICGPRHQGFRGGHPHSGERRHYPFAFLEHRTEQAVSMARAAPISICMTASFGEAVSRSGPRPFGYPQSWGDHRPKTSAKLICPSNKARIAKSVRFVTP